MTGQTDLLVALIELEPELLTLTNLEDYDFFLQAIANGSSEALQVLRPYITSDYLDDYLEVDDVEDVEDDEDPDEEYKYLTAVLDDLHASHEDKFTAVEEVLMALCRDKNSALHARLQAYFEASRQPQCRIF